MVLAKFVVLLIVVYGVGFSEGHHAPSMPESGPKTVYEYAKKAARTPWGSIGQETSADAVEVETGELVQGSAIEGAAVIAELACGAAAPVCAGVTVCVLAVAAVSFAAFVFKGSSEPEQGHMTPANEQADADVVDHDLWDADDQEKRIEEDLSLGDKLVHSLVAKGVKRTELAATIRAQVQKMKVALQQLLSDMHEIITYATKLKRTDDANLEQWRNCDGGWFNFCIAGAEPQRIVPPDVAKMSQKMKKELQNWGEQATSLASCMEDIDGMCDNDFLAASVDFMQEFFDQAAKDWTDYKGKLCTHHDWTVCTTESVLMELKAMDNPSRGADLLPSFCIMAFVGMAFGAALSRRRMRLPGNDKYQALLS